MICISEENLSHIAQSLSPTAFRLFVGGLMSVLYVGLWFVVEAGSTFWEVGGLADLAFFPAFVRVIGFLLIGLWIIPSLFLAFVVLTLSGAMIYQGLELPQQLGLGVLVASGGPLALALICRVARISTDLVDLNIRSVLVLSLACAAGNSVFYNAGLAVAGLSSPSLEMGTVIFVGDVIGCAFMLSMILGVMRIFRVGASE